MKNLGQLCFLFVVLFAQPFAYCDERVGVDCDCSETGNYSTPTKFAVPNLKDASQIDDQTFTSPGGNYEVQISADPLPTPPGTNLSITIRKGSSIRAQIAATVSQAAWAFSPDDHRFAYHCKSLNGTYTLILYDLEKSPPANETYLYSGLVVDQQVGFSPSGRYLACATKSETGHLTVVVADVLDPQHRQYQLGPTLGTNHAGWGFSPKNLSDDDPAFFWAIQTNTGVAAFLVNLMTMTQYNIPVQDDTWWGFSPCGDIFATVMGQSKTAFFYSTNSGALLATETWTGQAQNLRPRCDAQNHYIGDTPVIENTADKDCPGQGDTQAPTWPDDAELTADTITLDSLSLSWTPATDNVAVTNYQIYKDGELLATVDATVQSYDVADLEPGTEYEFSVQAGDEAGNWSSDGPTLVVSTLSDTAPSWPIDAELTFENLTETSLTLRWDQASDDLGVVGYRIYQDDYPEDILLGQVDPETLSFDVSGLAPYNSYCFYVSAGDAADQWTKGPRVCLETPDETPPYWPEPKYISPTNVETSSLELTWSEAEDNDQVVEYRLYVFVNGDWQLIAAGDRSTTVNCLSAYKSFVFKVEAVDRAGNESTDGPVRNITTASGPSDCPAVIERVSVNSAGEQTVGDPPPDPDPYDGYCQSDWPSISGDGQVVAFASIAINLVMDDTNTKEFTEYPNGWVCTWGYDIFVRDRLRHRTERVSVSSTGEQGELGNSSVYPVLSSDGRYVVFIASFSNLVPDDTNEKNDVFIHDRLNHRTRLVSTAADGTQGNDHCHWAYYETPPAVSRDGRFVAFCSRSSNLVGDDTNHAADVFVKDMRTGQIERVNVATDGTQANGESWGVDMTPDGRYVVFVSRASNQVPEDTNYRSDVFVRDRVSGTTERVSIATDGSQANGDSCRKRRYYGSTYNHWPAHISDDGRFVVFDSKASNLVTGDTNGKFDVFVHDRLLGRTERVSLESSGEEMETDCYHPDISGNGRIVAFVVGWAADVYVRDTILKTTEIVSSCPCGYRGNLSSEYPAVNYDGSAIAFHSHASNLLLDFADTNWDADIFVVERSVPPATDLVVELQYLPVPAPTGTIFACIFGIENLGPDDASGINATFVSAEGLQISSAEVPVGSLVVDANNLEYSLDSLAAGQRVSILIRLTGQNEGTFEVAAAATTETPERYAENNSASLEIELVHGSPSAELNGQPPVNAEDFAAFALDWKKLVGSFADLSGDGAVDIVDLALFCGSWLLEAP